jgi:hypothetical protein
VSGMARPPQACSEPACWCPPAASPSRGTQPVRFTDRWLYPQRHRNIPPANARRALRDHRKGFGDLKVSGASIGGRQYAAGGAGRRERILADAWAGGPEVAAAVNLGERGGRAGRLVCGPARFRLPPGRDVTVSKDPPRLFSLGRVFVLC